MSSDAPVKEEIPVPFPDIDGTAARVIEAELAKGTDAHSVLRALATAGLCVIPREPPDGLLVSMALRLDHGLLAPQTQIAKLREGATLGDILETPEQMQRRVQMRLSNMRKVYEEVSGTGFYSWEREPHYQEMRTHCIDAMTLFQAGGERSATSTSAQEDGSADTSRPAM